MPVFALLSGDYAAGRAPGDSERVSKISVTWATLALGAGGYHSLPADFSARVSVQRVVSRVPWLW